MPPLFNQQYVNWDNISRDTIANSKPVWDVGVLMPTVPQAAATAVTNGFSKCSQWGRLSMDILLLKLWQKKRENARHVEFT
jgi:hypothetical protein